MTETNLQIYDRLLVEFGDISERQKKLKADIYKVFDDKSISLDDRWALFLKVPAECLEVRTSQVHFYCLKDFDIDISWYDDFYLERRETMTMSQLFEMLNDNILDGYTKTWDLSEEEYAELIIAWKEEVLKYRLYSFDYDW